MQPPPIHPRDSGPRFNGHYRHATVPGSQIEARIQNLPTPKPQPNAAPPIQDAQTSIQKTESKSDSPKSKAAKPESVISKPRNEWLIMTICTVVALGAEILSAPTLIHLAEKVGFSYIELWFDHDGERARFWLSWMFPIVLDLYANVSAIVWFRSYPRYSRSTVTTAMWNTIVATALSVLCADMLHIIIKQNWDMSEATWLVVIVSAIPALVLGASVHLIAMVARDAATFPIRMHEIQVQIQDAMAVKSAPAESPAENPDAAEPTDETDDEAAPKSEGPATTESPKPSKPNRRRKGKRIHKPTAKPAEAEPPNAQPESGELREGTDAELEPIISKFVDEFIAEEGKLPGRGKVRDAVIAKGFKVGPERAGMLRDKVRPETNKENN